MINVLAFKGACCFIFAFAFTMILMPWVINLLRRLKAGQVIQKDGPQSHQSKSGTPTMGGIGIMIGLLITAALIYVSSSDPSFEKNLPGFVALVLLTVVYAVIGLVDDWLTMKPRNGKRGLSSKMKFGLQFIAAIAFAWWLKQSGMVNTEIGLGQFFSVNLGWAYLPFVVLFITGMANFINITDGLDGLAAGLTVILASTLAIVPLLTSSSQATNPFSLLLLGLAGACVAFLWFNFSPAKVFMGDTGSLAIGVLIPAAAIVMKLEVLMVIAGLVFILDGLSSALQWAVFKYTRITTGTGKRVFKMSPVHHHFELSGWAEQQVVVRFWIVGIVCAMLALALTISSQLR